MSEHKKRPNSTATLVNEIFSILCDLDYYFAEKNMLDEEGFFYYTLTRFKREWGILPDTVKANVKILSEMGWVDSKIYGAYNYSKQHPQNVTHYRINSRNIVKGIDNIDISGIPKVDPGLELSDEVF